MLIIATNARPSAVEPGRMSHAIGQPADQLRQALLLPQPLEHQRLSPRARGMRVDALGAHLLDDAQPLAELGERPEQRVECTIGDEQIAPPEVANNALAHAGTVADRLDDLKVLVGAARLDATLGTDEHAATIAILDARCKNNRPHSCRF